MSLALAKRRSPHAYVLYIIWKVYQAVNDTSDAPIIRIAIIFRRETSLDSLFARNRIKWGLEDLINGLSIEASCSLHLSGQLSALLGCTGNRLIVYVQRSTDLLENPSLVLQNSFGAKVTANLSVQKSLTTKVLEVGLQAGTQVLLLAGVSH